MLVATENYELAFYINRKFDVGYNETCAKAYKDNSNRMINATDLIILSRVTDEMLFEGALIHGGDDVMTATTNQKKLIWKYLHNIHPNISEVYLYGERRSNHKVAKRKLLLDEELFKKTRGFDWDERRIIRNQVMVGPDHPQWTKYESVAEWKRRHRAELRAKE